MARPMNGDDAFGSYHPAITFALFACAILLGMFVRHPAFLAASVLFSGLYYVLLVGRRAGKMIAGMAVLFCAVAAVNPLFNTMGGTVLFTYFGRPYTVEALAYGACAAALLVGMLLWFSCYNIVMTSDKFTYLFGGMAPAVTLVFTMVLRLVPTYRRKIDQLSAARAGIGRDPAQGTLRERVASAAAVLSALMSWALESGVATADSMRSRGFGQGPRVPYSRYRFTARDKVLLGCMIALALASAVAIAAGFADVAFIPRIDIPPFSPAMACGLVAYSAFVAIPSFITVRERILWRISLSNI